MCKLMMLTVVFNLNMCVTTSNLLDSMASGQYTIQLIDSAWFV